MMYRIFTIFFALMCFGAFAVAQTSQVSGITSSHDVVDQSLVGSSTFSITIAYSQPMDVTILPVISFPEPGKDPVAVGGLVPATSGWDDDHTFTQHYDVVDLNQTIGRIPVQVSGGADLSGNVPDDRTETDLFCLSTDLELPKIVNILADHKYTQIYIEFDISTNFGGLLSPWTHSDSLLYLQFPELGDLSAYFDFVNYRWITRYILGVNVVKKQPAEFRDIKTYFEWPIGRKDNANACRLKHYWNGDNFDLDFVAPYVTELSTNLAVITEADAGTGTFQIRAQFNENVSGDVVFSFPTLGEDPSNTLTLLNKIKTNGDSVVVATYNVANVSEFIPDIDIKVGGAVNAPSFNSNRELQADTVFTDVFSINTCAAVQAPQIVRSPDENIACPGTMLSVGLIAPGSGGSEMCADAYRYSTDNGTTWSEWSGTLPAFSAVPGTSIVMSRRSCGGNCLGDSGSVSWVVQDVDKPAISCPGALTVTCSANVPAVSLAAVSASDNCGTPVKSHLGDVTTNMTCTNRKTVTRTYKATDASGNTQTCSQIITVFDNVKPSFTSVPTNITVQCNSIPAVGTVTATDGCGGSVAVVYNGQTTEAGACPDSYTITRQWTATDACGNTKTATQRITVTDTQLPNFVSTPANVTVQCDTLPAPFAPVATDNCDAAVAVTYNGQTITNGACTNAYTLTRRWTAADNCGNTRSISQRITVVDSSKPVFSSFPDNTTIACHENPPAVGTPTAFDGCGNATVTYLGQSITSGNCPGNYQIKRTWRTMDACGNSTAATQTIQVSDNTGPVFTSVPDPLTIECGNPLPPVVNPAASDACGGYVHITFLGNTPSGSGCAADYAVTRIWKAEDLCGNMATTTQLITVLGNNYQEEGAENREDATTGLITHHASLIVNPNPTTDRVWLELTDFAGEAVTVSIFSELGQLIWERRIPAVEDLKLSVSLREAGAVAGIYTVSVHGVQAVVSKRVMLMD